MLFLFYLLVVVSLVGLDQFSKYLIVSHFDVGEGFKVIENFFSIHYVRNFGAGFSILQNQTVFLSMISLLAVCGLSYLLYTSKKSEKLNRLCYLLVISGSLGNFIDRIRIGYVVDFLDFILLGWDYPVFNVADCFICVGCLLLMISVLLENKNA